MIEPTDRPVSRRTFLTASSLAFLSASGIGNEAWALPLPKELAGFAHSPTSYGFVPLPDNPDSKAKRLLNQLTDFESTNPPQVEWMNPRLFIRGDSGFADHGLRLTVWGVAPHRGIDTPDHIDVDVLFEPFHSHRFNVWSYRKNNHLSSNAPTRLNVPVDPHSGLNLSVSMRWELTRNEEEMELVGREHQGRIHLAIDSRPGVARLLPGLYLMPLLGSGWSDLNRIAVQGRMSDISSPMLVLETNYGKRQTDPTA